LAFEKNNGELKFSEGVFLNQILNILPKEKEEAQKEEKTELN